MTELERRALLGDRQAQDMREKNGSYFYSNCAAEALKRKIADPKGIKITIVWKSEAGCPHFLWSDGKNDYGFEVERHLRWWEIFWFKGSIRKRNLGFNEKYRKRMNERRKARHDRT